MKITANGLSYIKKVSSIPGQGTESDLVLAYLANVKDTSEERLGNELPMLDTIRIINNLKVLGFVEE